MIFLIKIQYRSHYQCIFMYLILVKMKSKLSILFLLLISIASVQGQKKTNENILKELDLFYEKACNDWGIPGFSVAIVKDGKIIFSKGYGEKEEGLNERPDGNTMYAIASNTKAFTATMLGQLVEEGKCNWDDQVQKYLPWFQVYDPYISSQITIRDLLSHRVGLGTFSGDVIWYKSNLKAEDIIKQSSHLTPAFKFRAGYGYSNIMFIAAGKVIEAITGKTWYENARERILDPLEMKRTTIFIHELKDFDNVAKPHALDKNGNIPIPYTDWSEIAAMGGLFASVNDIAHWMITNMEQGIWKGKEVIDTKTLNTLWTPHNHHFVNHFSRNESGTLFNGYGLGWGLRDYHGRLFVGHTGGYDGMISAVSMLPDEKLGIVVLTNGMRSPYMALTYQTLDAFLGVNKGKDWSADLLERTLSRENSDTRITQRIESRIENTSPSLPLEKFAGEYYSDIYGKIFVKLNNGILSVELEHSPELSFTLEHFHYDVFKIKWEQEQAWFKFGTVKFNTDNYLRVTGIDFDVPNDDIFFEELKPRKVN